MNIMVERTYLDGMNTTVRLTFREADTAGLPEAVQTLQAAERKQGSESVSQTLARLLSAVIQIEAAEDMKGRM